MEARTKLRRVCLYREYIITVHRPIVMHSGSERMATRQRGEATPSSLEESRFATSAGAEKGDSSGVEENRTLLPPFMGLELSKSYCQADAL